MSKELEKERELITLRASNYHYDLGIKYERERIIELIDKMQKRLGVEFSMAVVSVQLDELKEEIKEECKEVVESEGGKDEEKRN